MKTRTVSLLAFSLLLPAAILAQEQTTYSWRYYRVGNTGIQGDYCQAIWIDPNGDPYIGGYEPEADRVRVAVYDVASRLVRTLASGRMTVGRHEVVWDGRDEGTPPHRSRS